MPFKVETPCHSQFEAPLPLDKTLAFFQDYKTAIGKHFYGLESFTKNPDGSYHWKFSKLNYKGNELQISFTTQFVPEGKNRIKIVPVNKGESSSLTGQWDFKEIGNKTQVTFDACLSGELPLPSLLKALVAPIAQQEVKKIFDRYVANVKKTLEA